MAADFNWVEVLQDGHPVLVELSVEGISIMSPFPVQDVLQFAPGFCFHTLIFYDLFSVVIRSAEEGLCVRLCMQYVYTEL